MDHGPRRLAAASGDGGEADLNRRREKCLPWIGEINYPKVAEEIATLGYRGPVGLEAWASHDAETALAHFREAFTIGA